MSAAEFESKKELRRNRDRFLREINEVLADERAGWQHILDVKFDQKNIRPIKLSEWSTDSFRIPSILAESYQIDEDDVIYRIESPEMTGESYEHIDHDQKFYLIVDSDYNATYNSLVADSQAV